MDLPVPLPRTRRAHARRAAAVALLAMTSVVGVLAAPGSPVAARGSRPQVVDCPAAAGNARFVRFLYLELLERCPDAGGAAYWTAKLDGGMSRWSVADALDLSTENLGRNNVDDLYDSILGRAATASERARWIAHIRASRENAVATATLVASEEGYARHTTASTVGERDQEWLAYAYNRILDRAPDPDGSAYYLGRFSPGGSTADQRFRVAMAFERSRSNALSWVRATMAEALGRPGDPAGVHYWATWLMGPGRWQTFKLWTLQLSSDEAYRRAQTQPS